MAQTIILKKSAVAGKVPQAADLEVGEVAINMADRILYFKDSSGVVVAIKGEAAEELTQNQVEASASTVFGLVSGQRIWQAISKWWAGIGTVFGKTLLGSANATAARTSLQLGTAATRNVGTAVGSLLEVNSKYFGVQSNSDFPNGTLIRTSFPAANTGPSITLKLWGKGYAEGQPHLIMVEAYQYNGGWYSISGINLSGNITNVTIMELGGYVCFWFATTGYWNSFFAEAYDTTISGYLGNRVTSIENSTKPAGTKVVDIPLAMTYNTSNIQHTTGQSTEYPMTQKAVTDAINARGFEDASGVLTAQSGDLSNAISTFLQATTQADAKSRLGVPTITVSAAAPSGGNNGDVWYKV